MEHKYRTADFILVTEFILGSVGTGGGIMLAAGNMLNALESLNENQMEDCQNHNDDYDFGKVLEFYGGDATPRHKFRYVDGTEEFFSFD